jgi:hypothetical protein
MLVVDCCTHLFPNREEGLPRDFPAPKLDLVFQKCSYEKLPRLGLLVRSGCSFLGWRPEILEICLDLHPSIVFHSGHAFR